MDPVDLALALPSIAYSLALSKPFQAFQALQALQTLPIQSNPAPPASSLSHLVISSPSHTHSLTHWPGSLLIGSAPSSSPPRPLPQKHYRHTTHHPPRPPPVPQIPSSTPKPPSSQSPAIPSFPFLTTYPRPIFLFPVPSLMSTEFSFKSSALSCLFSPSHMLVNPLLTGIHFTTSIFRCPHV